MKILHLTCPSPSPDSLPRSLPPSLPPSRLGTDYTEAVLGVRLWGCGCLPLRVSQTLPPSLHFSLPPSLSI